MAQIFQQIFERFFKCYAETKCPESRISTKYTAITEMIELHTSRVHLFSGFAKEQKTGDSVTQISNYQRRIFHFNWLADANAVLSRSLRNLLKVTKHGH